MPATEIKPAMDPAKKPTIAATVALTEDELHAVTVALQDEWRRLYALLEKEPGCDTWRRLFVTVDALQERLSSL